MLNNLKAEMARKDLTLEDIAERINVTPRTVSNWISGKHRIGLKAAFAIHEAFFPDLTVDYLFKSDND